MSNDYFNYGVLLPAGIARAGDVDSRFQAIETAFGYLPSRAIMGIEIKPVVTAGGTANALTVSNVTPLSSYIEGQRITFKAVAPNTSAATINVDGLGAKAIKRADATTVSAGDIVAGIIYDVTYNSSGSGFFQFVAATVGELATYAAAALASATTASTGAATATTKAGEASASAAAALVSQNAAAASASVASTSETNAASSASSASSSATTASTGASTATTKASQAATSATNAATSETNAATSASTAATKAGQAATSATNAATSETNAAASASTASTAAGTIPSPVGHSGSYLASDGSSTWVWSTPTGVLPSQTGNSGKYLTTNGTSSSWASLGSLAAKSGVNNTDWSGTALAVANGGTGATTVAGARTALALVPGTDVQAFSANLGALAGLTSAADKAPYFTGSGTAALATITAFARTVLDDADAATARTTLGAAQDSTALQALRAVTPAIGKAPYFDSSTTAATYDITAAGRNLVAQNDAASMRTTIGVAIGSDVQAYDAELAAIAGLASAANKLAYFTGAGTAALADLTAFARTLLDDADAATMRATLGAQALDAELTALAGLTSAANALPYFTGSGTAAVTTLSAFIRTLLDDADAATARATLGVSSGWTLASTNTGSYSNASPLVVSGLGSANDIMVVFEDVTFPNSNNLVVGISDTGVSYGTTALTTSTVSATNYRGSIVFDNARADSGSYRSSIGQVTSNRSISSGAQNSFAGWRVDGGISYVTVMTNNSNTLSGTFKIYTR